MELSRVAPDLRAATRRTPALPTDRAWVRRLVRAGSARMTPVRLPGVRTDVVPGVGAGLRVHRPDRITGAAAVLWIHGGGHVIGGPVQDDRLCAETARDAGVVVVAAGYRLSPEHPFPAALDDCGAAWEWLQSRSADLGVGRGRVVVGGQSAGGGIAAALVQRLHDGGGPQPLGQWLFCPMLDDRTAARRDLDAVGHRVWNNRLNRFGWASYLGVEPGAPQVPEHAVPARREDLRGLPPAWIGVGDVDLFHDEDRVYAERLRAAGVATTFRSVPGAPHGFEAWAPGARSTAEHLAAARAWLRDLVQGA